MSRKARITSKYLHVIVRGVGRQIIFEDDMDYNYYLKLLVKKKDDMKITILAYCLMNNHVHLLIDDPECNVSVFMKKTGISYAYYFNKKYDRVGHLFQDRFGSENILDEAALLAVYRYILKNPEKSGIAMADKYRWNSYKELFDHKGITNPDILRELIGDREKFLELMSEDGEEYIDVDKRKHDDSWALEVIKETLSRYGIAVRELQGMNKHVRNEYLIMLKSKGISVRQISRITGIERGVITRACH